MAEIETLQLPLEIETLIDRARNNQPLRVILEIGSYKGGTLKKWYELLTEINKDGAFLLISLDISNILEFKDKVNLKVFTMDSHSSDTFKQIKNLLRGRAVDLLFIDGDHSYDGVKKDCEMYSSLVRQKGIIAFHDIVTEKYTGEDYIGNRGVRTFWEQVKVGKIIEEIVDTEAPVSWSHGIGVIYKNEPIKVIKKNWLFH
jgi:predicted O-methyltransferase YrrM